MKKTKTEKMTHYNYIMHTFFQCGLGNPLILIEKFNKKYGDLFWQKKYDYAVQDYMECTLGEEFLPDLPEIEYLFNCYLSMYYFYKAGKKVYNLPTDMLQSLLNKQPKRISPELITLPYSTIYVQSPQDLGITSNTGIPTNGFYITLLQKDEFNYMEEVGLVSPNDARKLLYLLSVGNYGDEEGEFGFFRDSIPVIDDDLMGHIEGKIDRDIKREYLDEEERICRTQIWKLAVNIVLCMSANECNIEPVVDF